MQTQEYAFYMFRRAIHFAGSIAENLSIAKEGASREEMKTALEMACAWEFVKNCRKDWRQNWVNAEKGFPKDSRSGLPSHGIASQCTGDPLLDEATSALDEETEKNF